MNYEPGTLVNTDSIHRAMGGKGFAEFTRLLEDKWAARVYFSRKRQEKAAYLRRQIQYAATKNGLRPVAHLDKVARAWLDTHYPGWSEDDEFMERDLPRHHPETRVNLPTGGASNRVGWSREAETRQAKPSPPKKLVLTDERGNAL